MPPFNESLRRLSSHFLPGAPPHPEASSDGCLSDPPDGPQEVCSHSDHAPAWPPPSPGVQHGLILDALRWENIDGVLHFFDDQAGTCYMYDLGELDANNGPFDGSYRGKVLSGLRCASQALSPRRLETEGKPVSASAFRRYASDYPSAWQVIVGQTIMHKVWGECTLEGVDLDTSILHIDGHRVALEYFKDAIFEPVTLPPPLAADVSAAEEQWKHQEARLERPQVWEEGQALAQAAHARIKDEGARVPADPRSLGKGHSPADVIIGEVRRDPGGYFYLDEYHPKYLPGKERIPNPDFDDWSSAILDLKDCRPGAAYFFFKEADPLLATGVPICVVPSHDPASKQSGIRQVAQRLATASRIDATACLVRHQLIAKLSAGGGRSPQVHLASIRVENPHLISGQAVLLLDDVVTSGGSFRACEQRLKEAGAARVYCLAMGKTVRNSNSC